MSQSEYPSRGVLIPGRVLIVSDERSFRDAFAEQDRWWIPSMFHWSEAKGLRRGKEGRILHPSLDLHNPLMSSVVSVLRLVSVLSVVAVLFSDGKEYYFPRKAIAGQLSKCDSERRSTLRDKPILKLRPCWVCRKTRPEMGMVVRLLVNGDQAESVL